MKKNVLLLLIVAVVSLFYLSACTNNYDVSKNGHDDILDSSKQEYIAVDDGKFYLYSIDKTKKLVGGYDHLEFLDDTNEKFLLAYNDGDYGYSILDNDGNTLITSDKDIKIKGANLIYEITLDKESKYSYEYYGFVVHFVNSYGNSSTALYHLDGKAAFLTQSCQAEVLTTSHSDNAFSIIYIYFTSYDDSGKITSRKVIDKNLNVIHQLEFDKYKEFISSQSFTTSIGYIVYSQKEFDENDNEIASKVYYDIYCNNAVFAAFESVSRLSTFGNGNALFAKKSNKFTLFDESGAVREFDSPATVENNNIKVGNDLVDIYRYDGEFLLEGVRQGIGSYVKQDGDKVALYSYEGKELSLYNLNEIKRAETKRYVNLNTISEVVKHTDTQDKNIYKFFLDGALTKEYDASYTYVSDQNGVYIFTTKKNGVVDFYYYYNVHSGTEFIIKAQQDGTNGAEFNKVLDYNYYTEKHSKDISFYENAVKKITPYTGPYIPGYACKGGYFSITHQSLNPLKMVVLKLEFDIYKIRKVNLMDTYINLNERWYAYYAITDTGKSANIMYIYSGLSKMTIDYNSDYNLMCFSTIDRYVDKELYIATNKLDNKTLTFSVAQSKIGDRITLTKISEIKSSNLGIFDNTYLVGIDYNNDKRNFVYTIYGRKVLDTKYYIKDIKDSLAIINFIGPNKNNSFGVFDLTQNKVIKECNNFDIILLGGGCYAIAKMGKTGIVYEIRDYKSRLIKNNVISIEYIKQRVDTFTLEKCYYYKIYLNKKGYKLIKFTAS